jgi:hypothetical protein
MFGCAYPLGQALTLPPTCATGTATAVDPPEDPPDDPPAVPSPELPVGMRPPHAAARHGKPRSATLVMRARVKPLRFMKASRVVGT